MSNAPEIDKEKLREAIESVIDRYCDGTRNGLQDAHFIEYGDRYSPQKCADELVAAMEEFIKGGMA